MRCSGRVRVSSAELRLRPGFKPHCSPCFSVEGCFTLKRREFALCAFRITSLSNAIYGNSSEYSDDVLWDFFSL